ncbi:hypothetical protein QVZ41_02060 [Wenyingzhuangia sp. chi5]|uniref:Uncharacterized protein n=1 Tax=Wenyingzhuangia gilva TaxID=3057677 RepID=A0ABT8VNU5_9FLAO|nr:hypothetical protein [Wenyingzhuangia sp. chi5]MDO3693632.1 hypothetical protein [Wenyingzhuangia sp. chi5]
MKLKDIAIRVVKKAYRKLTGKVFLNPKCEMDRQVANDAIFTLLNAPEPCMISRFGTTEMNCINNYLCITSNKSFSRKIYEYITDYTHTPWWNTNHFKYMNIYSGIFPPSEETSEKFSERYLKDIPLIDLLGSFQYHEKFMPLKKSVVKVQLETLYPFFVENPWTRLLKGKKVLVVHPFDQSIREQYAKRKLLFKDAEILPDFELITFQAIQSVAGTKVPFKDWFEALEYMENKISKIDFDICILGCGAYGLPLAAHVKRMGKKAVHIGGGTQLLFGIKGKRWEEQYERIRIYRPDETINVNYVDLFNEHWIYPGANEKPKGAENVEGACYW